MDAKDHANGFTKVDVEDTNEDETDAMIKEYSVKEIRFKPLAESLSGSGKSVVVPQVIYTPPPRIIIKKPSSAGKFR